MKKASGGKLLFWAGVAFALQIALWTALFVLAARHPVAEVPLATQPARR